MCLLPINTNFALDKPIYGLCILRLVYEILPSRDHENTQHFLLLTFNFTVNTRLFVFYPNLAESIYFKGINFIIFPTQWVHFFKCDTIPNIYKFLCMTRYGSGLLHHQNTLFSLSGLVMSDYLLVNSPLPFALLFFKIVLVIHKTLFFHIAFRLTLLGSPKIPAGSFYWN